MGGIEWPPTWDLGANDAISNLAPRTRWVKPGRKEGNAMSAFFVGQRVMVGTQYDIEATVTGHAEYLAGDELWQVAWWHNGERKSEWVSGSEIHKEGD